MPNKAAHEAMDILHGLLLMHDYQPFTVQRSESHITVKPVEKGTFEVSIYDDGDSAMVTADRWHGHHTNPEQAAFCAMWLLTPYYRVVSEFIGGVMAAVWIERYVESGWEGMEPVYYRNPDAPEEWKVEPGQKVFHRYVQQVVVPPPKPYDELVPGVKLEPNGHPVGSVIGESFEDLDEPQALSLRE